MKYIDKIDYEWHSVTEAMPTMTAYVELLGKDGTIYKGEIVVEMSGFYVYDYVNTGWGSFDYYTHWRFDKEKNHYWEEQVNYGREYNNGRKASKQ